MTNEATASLELDGSVEEAGRAIGVRVQEERVRLGLTQAELADRLGVSRTSASAYEAGRHLPRAEVLVEFDKLGADVLYVLTGRKHVAPVVDIELLAFALSEARQQSLGSTAHVDERTLVERMWSIYLALQRYHLGR